MIEMSLADLRQPVMVTKALSASSAAKSRLGMSWAGVDRADLRRPEGPRRLAVSCPTPTRPWGLMADEKKKPTPAQERIGMNPPPVVVYSIEQAGRLRAEVDARIQAALKRRSDTTDTQNERTVGPA